MLPYPSANPLGILHCRPALRFAMALLASLASPYYAQATTCASANTINPASLPITNQALVCGTTNDLNSTTVPGTLCGSGSTASYKNGKEALYQFTPTVSGAYSLSVQGQTSLAAMVYSGCPTLNNCIYGAGAATGPVAFTLPLAAGTTYFIWFDTWPSPASPCPGTFSLKLLVTPANDDPCGATTLPVNAACTYTASTTTGATATLGVPAPSCANYAGGDVWFKAVVPAAGGIIVNTAAGVITDGGMALYTATACNGTFTQVSCNDDFNAQMPGISATGLTPGSTVYIRFWAYGNASSGSFSICAAMPPPPPACGGTYYDSGGAAGNYGNGEDITYTICPSAGQTVSLVFSAFNVESCCDHLYIYDGPTIAAPLLGTFSGTALPPILTSSHPSGCLTVRFTSDGSINYTGWAASVFCTPRPTGDCIYALRLSDSGNDGWGASSVGVRINGGAYTWYTVAASANFALIGVNLGNLVEINYNASGPNQNQNQWSIGKLGQLPYFTSTTPPAAGITFTQTVTCGPPPALPQDCAGGVTVCSNQNITNSSTNTGQVADLNAANQGCLSGERQGTWYFFSPQTTTTIAFSITPANGTDDYDFAVWGPFASAQCPTGPPIRCSYDAPPPYTTGLNATAVQTSEGASGTGWVKDIAAQAGEVYALYIDNFSASGQAFTLNWQLSGGGSLDCAVLPVELLSLEATAQEPVVHVAWSTATEHNSSHFNVLRSADNSAFTSIGTVMAAGNAEFRSDYLFVDEAPFRGTNYYRLEQVDRDGAAQRSKTVVAMLGGAEGRLSIYPNPAGEMLNILFPMAMAGPVEVVVLDALGSVVFTRATTVDGAAQAAQIRLDGMAKGWYSLRASRPDGIKLQSEGFFKE